MKWSWRSRRTVLIGAAVVVTILLGAVFVTVNNQDSDEQVTNGPPTTIPPPDETFADVPDDHPARDDISWLVSRTAFRYPDGTYRPDGDVSQQVFIELLWKLSGSPSVPLRASGGASSTTPSGPATAMAWANDRGLAEPLDGSTFHPDAAISRQEAAAVLLRLSGLESLDFHDAAFSDVDPTSSYFPAISFVDAANLDSGFGDGTFRPATPVSGASAAVLLHQFAIALDSTWPAPHDYHSCTDPVTPDQQEAADELSAAVQASLERWPTEEAAIADGFVQSDPGFFSNNMHYLNPEFASDGISLDPQRPESLMFSQHRIVAAMFVMEHVYNAGPTPAGCLTTWHFHNNYCFDGPPTSGGYFVSIVQDGCPDGSMLRVTPGMMHVWVIKRPQGPFDGAESGM